MAGRLALLDEALVAAGGLRRWHEVERFAAHLSIGTKPLESDLLFASRRIHVEGSTRLPTVRRRGLDAWPRETPALSIIWQTFVMPFLLTEADVQTEELAPRRNGNDAWRRLFVWLPKHLAVLASQQTLYFDVDGRQRRIDYRLDDRVPAVAVAQFCDDHTTFSGITIPARQRALRCDAGGQPLPGSEFLVFSILDATFSRCKTS